MRGVARAALLTALVASLLTLLAVGLGPRTGRYRTVTVLSGSMEPAIAAGSVVIVTPVRATDVAPGDVVTFNAPIDGAPVVTHRVVAVEHEDGLPVIETKGDANLEPDPWRARIEDPVAWVVRADVPLAGFAIIALRGPVVRALCVYAAPALAFLAWAWEIWRPRGRAPEAAHA